MQYHGWILKTLQALILLISIWSTNTYASYRDEKVREALLYMDRGQASSALTVLLDLRNHYPNDRDIEITLASAYVGHTRITIHDFIPLFKKIKENAFLSSEIRERRDRLFQDLYKLSINNDVEAKEFLEQWQRVTELTDNLMYIFEYLRLVPSIDAVEAQPLMLAADVFRNASFELSKGDAAFSILIELVLIKHKIATNYYFTPIDTGSIDLSTDAITLSLESLRRLKEDLLSIMRRGTIIASNDTQINKSIAFIEQNWSTLEEFLVDADRERVNLLLYCITFEYDCK
jgi:hypothetical protein